MKDSTIEQFPIKEESDFDMIKRASLGGAEYKQVTFASHSNPEEVNLIWNIFSKYFKFYYDCIFIKESKFSIGNVTNISDKGIRIEYRFYNENINEDIRPDYEWIRFEDELFIGNFDSTERKFEE